MSAVLICGACSSEISGGTTDSNGSAKAGSGLGPVSAQTASGGRHSSPEKNAAGGAVAGSPSARPSLGSSSIVAANGGANSSVHVANSGGDRGSGEAATSTRRQLPGGASSSGGAGGTSDSRSTNSDRHTNQGGFETAGGAASSGGSGTTTGVAGSGAASIISGPCDIFRSAGTPCVAAHSTVRALLGEYDGRLYQVRRADNTTKDIATLGPGGFADGPSQDTFCAGTTCVITVVYDQSGKGNDLWYQGSTTVPGSPQSSPAKATTETLT
ncbi:MAG TPA: arabinofuranosidase catalytic domain-containing protein, partial [Polyangiaceae bacterium]|nr:arabinofuranosidase catalytic domain-containing protein [Polyangiaceae bacterium]